MAVSLLGLRRIRTLVVGRCLVQAVSGSTMPHVDADYFWRRSVTTAGLAARFADQLASPLREEALLGGLLSEVGIPVLATCAPDRYQPAAEAYGNVPDEEFVASEIDAVGTSHEVAGQRVFERWCLPESISLAVRYHHEVDPDASTGATVTQLARIVHGSSVIAAVLCETPISRDITETCEDVLYLLELNNSVLHRMLRELEADLAELASNLNIAPLCRRSLGALARTVVERLPVTA
jgi:HD-like signal output (HDOD) protein